MNGVRAGFRIGHPILEEACKRFCVASPKHLLSQKEQVAEL